jgi:phage terminase large subunit-like protein
MISNRAPSAASSLLEILRCEENLYTFFQEGWHAIEGNAPLFLNWHLEAVCEHLEAATRGEIKKMIISIPPRCSKSNIISVMWPAWVWTRNPSVRFLFASYAQKISLEHSRLCRMLIESPWYQQRWGHIVKLSKDQASKGHFTNTAMGHRISTSVGAGGTALGGDILIMDDPNDAGESDVTSESTNDWASRVWPSRLNPGGFGVNILTQQRTRVMDVSGYWMSKDEDNRIVKLILPMEFEESRRAKTVPLPSLKGKVWQDPRKEEGELLCPSYLSPDVIAERKVFLGRHNYATQYQQRPAPVEGGIIRREDFQVWHDGKFPKFTYVVQSWDCALTDKKTSSYSACTTWGLFEKDEVSHLMLISAWRDRISYPILLKRAKRLQDNFLDIDAEKLEPDYRMRPDRVLIEGKASGYSLASDLSSKGMMANEFNPDEFGDKTQRVHLASPYIECGRIWVKQDNARNKIYTDHEMLIDAAAVFPDPEGRDLVDTMTQVILYLSKKERRLTHTMSRSFEADFIGRKKGE